MAANLAGQLSKLRPDQLATITFEAGFDANLVFSTASYEAFVANSTNGANPGSPPVTAAVDTVQTALQAGGAIKIAFYNQGATFAFSQAEIDNAMQALAIWSGVANIRFIYDANPNTADVIFVHAGDKIGPNPTPVAAGTYFSPSSTVATANPNLLQITGGYIALDNTTTASGGGLAYGDFTSLSIQGGYGFDVLVHEVGHLVGLGHTGPYNFNLNPALNVPAPSNQNTISDVRVWSIMSYIDPNPTQPSQIGTLAAGYNPIVSWGLSADGYPLTPLTPMGLDIIAAQRLVGAPTSSLFGGGQIFGFNSNIRYTDSNGAPQKLAVYDFSLDPLPVLTLYDYGPNNTLDLSQFNTKSTVDLRDGTFSSVAGLTNNIFIEWGTRIDTVIGGSNNDVFTANADGDTIDGGGGTNNVVLADSRASYAYSKSGNTFTLTDTNPGRIATNRLTNIQSVTFSDGTVAASALSTISWTGAINNDFGTAGNWSPNQVPGAASDVQIILPNASVQVVQQQTNTLNSLFIGATDTLDITVGQFGFSGTSRASVNDGQFEVDNGASTYFGGNLSNSGTIIVGGVFMVAGPTVSISGGGRINLLGGNIGSYEDANGSPLQYDIFQNVDNTISGFGVIGSSGFSFPIRFFNAGTVLANAPLALTVKGATTNTGVLTDSAGGLLDLTGVIANTGGTILSTSTGTVVLDGVTIQGGQLLSNAGGGFTTFGSVTLDSSGAPITLDANLTLAAGSGLTIVGPLVGTGTLIGAGGGLFISGRKVVKVATQGAPAGTIVSAGGAVYLGAIPPLVLPSAITIGPDQSATFTQGAVANGFTANFTNSGTISLAGTTGGGGLMLIDSGPLTATPIAFSGHGTIVLGNQDDSIMGLHGVGGTDSLENIDNLITGQGEIGAHTLNITNDTGGTIIANGGTLSLDPSTAFNNGWLGAGGTGVLLAQVDLHNAGTVGSASGGTVAISGSLTNSGTVGAGAGSLVFVIGNAANSGAFGNAAGGNVVMLGTLKSGGTGDLGLFGTVTLGGSFGATTVAGVVQGETVNAGAMVQIGSQGGTLDRVTNKGRVVIGPDRTATVTGNFNNQGSVALSGSFDAGATIDHPASLLIQGSVTLSGSGTVALGDIGDRLAGSGTLENINNVISGRGSIDSTHLLLINDAGGTILGDAAGLTLNGASFNVVNYGTLKAGAGGTLELIGSITNGTGIVFSPTFSFGGIGTLVASGSGARLRLGEMVLQNGIIASDTGGEVHITGATTLASDSNFIGSFGGLIGNGASIAVENTANLIVDTTNTLTLINGLGNAGTVSLASGATLLGGGQLTAGGTVTLAGGARITASGTLLQNLDNLIHGAGTIDGGTGGLSNEGGTIFADGGTLVVSAAAAPFLNQSGGVLKAGGGVLHFNGDLTNSNVMIAGGGTIEVAGTLSGSGQLTLAAGGRISLGGMVFASQAISFVAAGATLDIGDAAHMTGAISGLVTGDVIHLTNVAADSAVWNGSTLNVMSGGTNDAQLSLFGSYGGLTFNAVSDGGSGTNISIACFLEGTLIRTPAGDRPVETLAVGDQICSTFGGTAPVIWHGRRQIDCRRHPRPHDVCPIRVSAHAFGHRKPARDLLLSPDHAVHVRDVLIPIRYLVNGATVRQERRDIVTYHHIELPVHDVVFAEGLAAETYLDTGNRTAFAGEQGGATMLHADFARAVWATEGCAPLHVTGSEVAAVRHTLLSRAVALGHARSDDPDLMLFGDDCALTAARAGGEIRVTVPPGCKSLRLVSRRFVPAQQLPGAEDHRVLGVALAAIRRDGVALAAEDPALASGWHAAEPDWRWTNGDATIFTEGARELSFTIAAVGRYWVAAPPAVSSSTG